MGARKSFPACKQAFCAGPAAPDDDKKAHDKGAVILTTK
jgi:hypothetical protein